MIKKLFFLCFVVISATNIQYLNAATLSVGDSGDYQTIQEAVNAAQDSDKIYIYNGIYHETITTSKNLNFEGESKAGVIWAGVFEPVGTPSWSKTAGYKYVYQCAATDATASGSVTRIVDEDRKGLYERVSSITEVDALPGQFYVTGGILYVRCPDDASPATHTLWYSDESYVYAIYLSSPNGEGDISNITFVGRDVLIKDYAADLGTINISNCDFYAAGLMVYSKGSNAGGTLNISNCKILYAISPVYDSDYPVHTNEDGGVHTYEGAALTLEYLENVNVIDTTIRYTRTGISFNHGHNFTADRCLLTDFCVHPAEFGGPSSSSVYTFQNCIFAMHGSTIYVPTGSLTSEANDGFRWNFYNNTIYSGEASKRFFNPAENPADAAYVSDVTVYIYNNLFIMDYLSLSIGGALDGDNLFMDNNYYAVGDSGDFIRYDGVSYTLSEWQTYTDGQGWSRGDSSISAAVLSTVSMVVEDEEDGGNPNFGKVNSDSPVIGQATATYAPSVDYFSAARPNGAADDIGIHEVSVENEDNLKVPGAPGDVIIQ